MNGGNKLGLDILMFSGFFFMIVCISCVIIMSLAIRYFKKRDQHYKVQQDIILKAIEGDNEIKTIIIEQLRVLIREIKKADT